MTRATQMTDDETLALLRRLEPDLSTLLPRVDNGELIDCGPFRALASRGTGWANLVMPTAAPTNGAAVVDAVDELRRRYAERGRTPRFVFKEPLFPALAAMLESAGLSLSEREPLMVCGPGDLRPSSRPGVSVRFLRRFVRV